MSRSGPVVLTVVLPAVPTSLLVPSERPDHLSELLLPFSTLRCRQVPGTPGGGNYGSSNCDTCRGRKSPLGVSMRLCSEKSCVSQRHCPLTDIYPPLSLLFLFSLFLPPSPILPLSSLPHSSLVFFPPFSQAWSEVSPLQQESLQKAGSDLRLLDESERLPLCPSASGALSKFGNCRRPQRGGRGRGRVCPCERCRKPGEKRIEERRDGMMKTSRAWAPLLLLPLTSLVS